MLALKNQFYFFNQVGWNPRSSLPLFMLKQQILIKWLNKLIRCDAIIHHFLFYLLLDQISFPKLGNYVFYKPSLAFIFILHLFLCPLSPSYFVPCHSCRFIDPRGSWLFLFTEFLQLNFKSQPQWASCDLYTVTGGSIQLQSLLRHMESPLLCKNLCHLWQLNSW